MVVLQTPPQAGARPDGRDSEQPAASAAATLLRDVRVEVTRKRSNIGLKPKHKGALRSLGLRGKIRETATHRLTPDVAGNLQVAHPFVETRLVLPSNYKFGIPTSEAVRLVRGRNDVSNTRYELENVVGTHLQWANGDTARLERHAEFLLVAWTTRLSASEALLVLYQSSHTDDVFLVDTLDESLTLDPRSPPPSQLQSHLVRLMRLEGETETLIWEIPFTGQPAIRRPAKGGRPAGERERPLFAVLAEEMPVDRLRHHIEKTATAPVAIAADKLLAEL